MSTVKLNLTLPHLTTRNSIHNTQYTPTSSISSKLLLTPSYSLHPALIIIIIIHLASFEFVHTTDKVRLPPPRITSQRNSTPHPRRNNAFLEIFMPPIEYSHISQDRKRHIKSRELTEGLGMHRLGGGAMGSGAARYGGGEYLPEGKQPGADIGVPCRPLLLIILSGEYIIFALCRRGRWWPAELTKTSHTHPRTRADGARARAPVTRTASLTSSSSSSCTAPFVR